MGFRRGGAGKRRDANETGIVDALRAFGATVIQLSGSAPIPDLLMGYRGRWTPLEIKTSTGGFTPGQREAWTNGQMGPVVVRTVEEALKAIGAMR